eukprot:s694_g21.t1
MGAASSHDAITKGKYAEAIVDFDQALKLAPQDADALKWRGDSKRMEHKFAEAIVDFDQALKQSPQDAFALKWRGDSKRMEHKYAEAIVDFDQALKQSPQDAFALKCRGETKRMQGKYAEAIVDFDQALKLAPQDAFALTGRGETKRMQGKYAEAIVDFDQALKLAPQDAFVLKCRGETKCQQGKYAEAIVDFDQALCLESPQSEHKALWFYDRFLDLRSVSGQISRWSRWAIVGAGPVGLCLALSLAEYQMDVYLRGPPREPLITVYESRWLVPSEGGSWKRDPAVRARDQVVTVQDAAVQLFSEAVQTCFEGERVWLHSRNVPVAEIEDKLLRKVQEAPFSKYIRIEKSARLTQKEDQAEFIQGLPADFIVGADGAASLSRRAFPDKFVCPHSRGFNIEEQRIRLAETEDGCVHADHVLGIILQQDARPPQEQSLNVIFTLAQNVYLLNSQKGSKGFLNIRITKEEYDEIYRATGQRGCTFGNPIQLKLEESLDADDTYAFHKVKLPWLRRRIEEGLKLFGMRTEHMLGITGFQLMPAYVQSFCHVLPGGGRSDRQRVLLLAGDAAISHHFWPGRGLNTGLKSVKAIVRMLASPAAAEGLQRYNSFMTKLRVREMQGRSSSMMKESVQLGWGSQLLSNAADDLIAAAKCSEAMNRRNFLKNCKLWRDLFQSNPEWGHDPVTDNLLQRRIMTEVAKPKALELHLMVRSAFDNGPGRAAGWPTSRQGGREVDPADDEHWA